MARGPSNRYLAVGGWISAVGVLGFALALPVIAGRPQGFVRFDAWREVIIQTVVFSTVGAVIVWHRARQPIGLLLLVTGIWPACAFLLYQYAQLSVPAPPGAVWSVMAAIVVFNVGPACWVLVLLLFPDGRLPSTRWWPVPWVLGVTMIANVAFVIIVPGPLDLAGRLSNPWGGLGGALIRSVLGQISGWFMFAVVVMAFASPIVRFRRSRGRERQQIKILVYALASAAALLVLPSVLPADAPYVFRNAFWTFGIAGFAWAIGIAVLRHQLYDIDRAIGRTVTYVMLTGLLGALYVAGTLLFGTIFRARGESSLAVAASTLAVAAAFRPARRRIQTFVDRRFNRSRYDVALTLEAFSARLRTQLDLNAVHAELLAAVHGTLQPARASLWVRRRTT